MTISPSSRRWLIRLIILAVLLVPFVVAIAMRPASKLTPDQANVFVRDLSNRHANESEVMGILGDGEKSSGQQFATGFADVDFVRKWSFQQETFDRYSTLETTGIFDCQGRLITCIMASERYEGARLWSFRWQRMRKAIGF